MSSPQLYVPTGDLTIATVREFKAALVDMMSDGKSGTLDLAGVLRVDAAALQVPANDADAANRAAAQRPLAEGVPLAFADDAEVASRRRMGVGSATAQPHMDEHEGKSRTTSGCSVIKSLTVLSF